MGNMLGESDASDGLEAFRADCQTKTLKELQVLAAVLRRQPGDQSEQVRVVRENIDRKTKAINDLRKSHQ